jgi:hypothetical protein
MWFNWNPRVEADPPYAYACSDLPGSHYARCDKRLLASPRLRKGNTMIKYIMNRLTLIVLACCAMISGAVALDFSLPALRQNASDFDKLYYAYRVYAFVKGCNELRQGYASIYINNVELERARIKIKAIEGEGVAVIKPSQSDDDFVRRFFRNGSLDTNALFADAVVSINGKAAGYQQCHVMLRALFDFPTKTGNMVIDKDF